MPDNDRPSPAAFTRHRDTAPAFWSADCLWILLATGDETHGRFALMESRCPKGSGALSHLHMEHDETFFVREGTVEFMVADMTFTADAGDFIAVPRWTPHSFRIVSPTSRLLHASYPAGLEQVIRHTGTPADNARRVLPPPDLPSVDPAAEVWWEQQYGTARLTRTPPVPVSVGVKPLHRRAGEGAAFWEVGIRWILAAVAEETGGVHSFLDEYLPHGPAAPPHRHDAADEIFYVMDGEATFFAGDSDQALSATAGSLVFIPRQTRHSFQINSPTARLLNAYTPAGFEHTIPPVAVPATAPTLPPPTLPPTDMQAAMRLIAEINQKYPGARTTVFAPDFLNHP